jgi:hypothetical protein
VPSSGCLHSDKARSQGVKEYLERPNIWVS